MVPLPLLGVMVLHRLAGRERDALAHGSGARDTTSCDTHTNYSRRNDGTWAKPILKERMKTKGNMGSEGMGGSREGRERRGHALPEERGREALALGIKGKARAMQDLALNEEGEGKA